MAQSQLKTQLNNALRNVTTTQNAEVNAQWAPIKNGEFAEFCRKVDGATNKRVASIQAKVAKAIADIQADAADAIARVRADAEEKKQAKEKELRGALAADRNYKLAIDTLQGLLDTIDQEG